jgi:hypothetical protein
MDFVVISQSVGRNGRNLDIDVAKIGAALVAVGPDNGGIYGVPLSIEGLAQAIESFQTFNTLPSRDGRVDPKGGTLRKINSILFPGQIPAPIPHDPSSGLGTLQKLDVSLIGLATSISGGSWTPVEDSLKSEMEFKWAGTPLGEGDITYFQLDANVIPKYFGVLVPKGLTDFSRTHIFFHPTPGQAGYNDGTYFSMGDWYKIFHYMTDLMAKQFCAAGMGRVLIMPLMTSSAAGDCGMFPQRWENLAGKMLGMISSGDFSDSASPVSISDTVVSSFSSGITYSHYFRGRAGMGSKLTGVIDFDGGISSFRAFSAALAGSAGRVVRMQQMPANVATLGTLATQNIFPLPRSRWGDTPYHFPRGDGAAVLQVHGAIPQSMMYIAARRAG